MAKKKKKKLNKGRVALVTAAIVAIIAYLIGGHLLGLLAQATIAGLAVIGTILIWARAKSAKRPERWLATVNILFGAAFAIWAITSVITKPIWMVLTVLAFIVFTTMNVKQSRLPKGRRGLGWLTSIIAFLAFMYLPWPYFAGTLNDWINPATTPMETGAGEAVNTAPSAVGSISWLAFFTVMAMVLGLIRTLAKKPETTGAKATGKTKRMRRILAFLMAVAILVGVAGPVLAKIKIANPPKEKEEVATEGDKDVRTPVETAAISSKPLDDNSNDSDKAVGWVDKTGAPVSLRNATLSFRPQGSQYLERPNGVLDTVGELFEASRIEGNPTWFAKLENLLGISQKEFQATAEMEKAEGYTPRAIFINGGMDISEAEARAIIAERWGYSQEEVDLLPIVRPPEIEVDDKKIVGVVNTYLAKDGNVYTFIDENQWVEVAVGLFDQDTEEIKFGVKIDCANIITPLAEHDYSTGLPRVDKEDPGSQPEPETTTTTPTTTVSTMVPTSPPTGTPETTPTTVPTTTPTTVPTTTSTTLEPKSADPKDYVYPTNQPTVGNVETDPVNTKTPEPVDVTTAPPTAPPRTTTTPTTTKTTEAPKPPAVVTEPTYPSVEPAPNTDLPIDNTDAGVDPWG